MKGILGLMMRDWMDEYDVMLLQEPGEGVRAYGKQQVMIAREVAVLVSCGVESTGTPIK